MESSGSGNGGGTEGRVIRSFPYERVFAVACRSLHLVGAGAVTGWILLGSPARPQVSSLLWFATATGLALQLNDLYRYGLPYFATVMFWLVAAKLALLGLALHVAPIAAPCIVLSVLASGVVSHMPGTLRHRRLWPPSPGEEPVK